MKKLLLLLGLALFSCSKSDEAVVTPTPTTCNMYKIAQQANVTLVNGSYDPAKVVWSQIGVPVFYSNVCSDEGKIVYENAQAVPNNPNVLWLVRNIIKKQ